jgi:cation transport ATPase
MDSFSSESNIPENETKQREYTESKINITQTKITTTTTESKAIEKIKKHQNENKIRYEETKQNTVADPNDPATVVYNEKIEKLDKSIYKTQSVNRFVQLCVSYVSIISFVIGLVSLIIMPFQMGDVGYFMIWLLLELFLNIMLTTHSCKYSKIKPITLRLAKIKSRVKFYIAIGASLLLVNILVLVFYRIKDVFKTAFTPIEYKASSTITNMGDILYNRCLLYFMGFSLVKECMIGTSIATNVCLYKQACKRNICDFIKSTKDQFAKQ